MKDLRIEELARNLVAYSCAVKPGEKVLIEVTGTHEELAEALVSEVYKAGGFPFVSVHLPRIERAALLGTNAERETALSDYATHRMEHMQAYIGIRGGDHASENSDVPPEMNQLHAKLYWQKVHGQIRVKKTKWVVLRYPTPSMAQLAGMSSEAFEDYYFKVCNLDYAKMDSAMNPLMELLNKTSKVHIKGEGTDIAFSIAGVGSVKCSGHMNIPDGEVYTAPVRDSANGVISYNTPSLYNGFTYEGIRLTFKDGKIVEAVCNDNRRINSILDTDEGARYLGEFALGVHPYIQTAMKDTLFDEKICGSIHLTPGSCYDDADNGNKSAIHWDLVYIQRSECGGGEIYFDDMLIRKDGRFTLPELSGLNPENLV